MAQPKTPSTTALEAASATPSSTEKQVTTSSPPTDSQVNASGHRDQLTRHYGLLSICSFAITTDNAWVAFAGSLSVALLNGGPPGVIYEFLVACVYYTLIGAAVAELASALPTSGGVYHWASITPGPRYGRVIGFFAGYLNFFGWLFGLASIVYIPSNVICQMWAVSHDEYEFQPWHAYIVYVVILWAATAFVVWGNRFIPRLQKAGLFIVLAGLLTTVVVVAAVPKSHASSSFVWKDFENETGWSDGVAFLSGVLNGAFAIGTPDSVSHVAEELPCPKRDLPKAIFAQIGLGCLMVLVYAMAVMYGIQDLQGLITTNATFPVATVYFQATNSAAATIGLLFIILLSAVICVVSVVLLSGRLWWTLARDVGTPLHELFSKVNEDLSCPVPATVFCALLTTAFGAITLGSKSAFQALVGSFVILTTTSILLAILPDLLTGRKYIPRGWFHMGRPGFILNGLTSILIVVFNIFFCFPFASPFSVAVMNWNSVILAGLTSFAALWWVAQGHRHYRAPKIVGFHLDLE